MGDRGRSCHLLSDLLQVPRLPVQQLRGRLDAPADVPGRAEGERGVGTTEVVEVVRTEVEREVGTTEVEEVRAGGGGAAHGFHSGIACLNWSGSMWQMFSRGK